MTTQLLPEDPLELNRLYDETVEAHKVYLEKVHDAFDRRCEEIRIKAHQKLDALPESDTEGHQKVVAEEKVELDKSLSELKAALHRSGQDARKKLEEIQAKLETGTVSLERELAQV
ncbi:MAG: hypothetical protein V1908_02370 [Candidatus Peregrinibacteria bacterium]